MAEKNDNHPPSPSREVVEFVVLDTLMKKAGVSEVARDFALPDFQAVNIAHGALVVASKMFPGDNRESVIASEAFLAGAAFVLKTVEQAGLAEATDSLYLDGVNPAA